MKEPLANKQIIYFQNFFIKGVRKCPHLFDGRREERKPEKGVMQQKIYVFKKFFIKGYENSPISSTDDMKRET